jgi:hypothetical protein
MFTGREIESVVRILQDQGARLYHACQLADFRSYIVLDGIPSRQRLEEAGLPSTSFRSDDSDRARDLWGVVFLNLEDSLIDV